VRQKSFVHNEYNKTSNCNRANDQHPDDGKQQGAVAEYQSQGSFHVSTRKKKSAKWQAIK